MTSPLFKRANSNLITKKKARTDSSFGKYPEARPIREHLKYGIINLDKPRGPTSHETVAWVKRILEVEKAGHSGTLDPRVSGVLPVALESATKALTLFFGFGKEYICIMRLHGDRESEKVIKTIRKFQGEIYQRPPVKSAVKRQLRVRKIYYLNVEEITGQRVLMRIGCEAGTYIRKLCHDIGLLLGTGAHMEDLRRTQAGPFREDQSVTLHDLKDAYMFWKEEGSEKELRKVVRPIETAISHLKRVVIRDTAVDAICHGAELAIPGISQISPGIKKGEEIAIITLKNEFVAIGESILTTEETLTLEAGIMAKTKRVMMPAGTYPAVWKTKVRAGVA